MKENLFNPKEKDFEKSIDGKEIRLFTLQNSEGSKVYITNYGARIVGILVPDKNGNLVDVGLGHKTIGEYIHPKQNYYGAIVGRVCGRIKNAEFRINDKLYKLTPNNENNLLHGGDDGFHTQVFEVVYRDENKLVLQHFSKNGEAGFPGNLTLKVIYEWTDNRELKISYEANTDSETAFNVTNHAYFNLNGEGNGDVLKHTLQIFADEYLPINEEVLSTGEFNSVKNTAFDFTNPKTIGADIDNNDVQLKYGSGYDHTFVLSKSFNHHLKHAASIVGDLSGIRMDVYTDQPGMHFYTGNFMDESMQLKTGQGDARRTGFCFETQHFSGALNFPQFPSIILKPNETFESATIFKFS